MAQYANKVLCAEDSIFDSLVITHGTGESSLLFKNSQKKINWLIMKVICLFGRYVGGDGVLQ